MNALKLVTSTLVLVAYFSVTTAADPDFSPCTYGNLSQVNCISLSAPKVLEAFRRNDKHKDIEQVYLLNIPDMTDDILGEIFDIVASTAADKVEIISLYGLHRVKKIPTAFRKFTKLAVLYFWEMHGIETLPAGSMTFSSNNLDSIKTIINPNLNTIEPGAFQGNFNGATILLNYNNFNKFDEAVFKPLLTESTVKIEIFENPIPCDCGLAWIFRDNGKFLPRTLGNCIDNTGKKFKFSEIDSEALLKSC